jgi:pSer/pThr/pTyr-binding forkhead associated (FHA) protein
VSFVLQRVSGRGLVLNQVAGNLLRIGRGTSAELRSENPAVALDHAAIEGDANGYTINDKGSITGTYVNRKPAESARLTKGDVIEIGDLRIEVQLADPARPLFLRISSTASRAAGRVAPGGVVADEEVDEAPRSRAGGALKAPKIDYVDAFRLKRPYLTKVSLIAFLAVVALAIIAQVTQTGHQTAFMPGGVSSAHARARDANGDPIARNCNACHDPWRGVIDQRCVTCHGKVPHAEAQAETPPCISCHAEHRGALKLALIPDSRCTSCHANLQDHVKAGVVVLPAIAHIGFFGKDHPDFEWPPDTDSLRFNHKRHLQAGGIFNATGQREVLTCTTCHKLVESRANKFDPKPIKFAVDCQRCHKLTFDPRFPDAEAPHGGDPGLVYGFVLAMYAGNSDIVGKSPEEIRRILTSRPPSSPDERAVLNAEQVIKTKCSLCHEIRRNGTQLAATPPVIPTRWLAHANFTHTAHRNLDCESCHGPVHNSSLTSDVMMPARKDCLDCHGSGKQAASTCATCHDYHERSRNLLTKAAAVVTRGPVGQPSTETGGGVGMLGIILVCSIVLLLLVLLIPVGIAIYKRLQMDNEERAAQRRPVAAPQAKAKVPPIAVPPSPAAPPRQQAPVPPPPAPAGEAAPPARPFAPPSEAPRPVEAPVSDATRIVGVDEQAPAAPATEMVQWYGMLLCTAGVLEGQRFIVDEQGFYIGRDPSLSKVVIPDARISKRHTRIIPRDGKVWAIDQSSTNGTFLGKVGGQRVTEVQLKRGDTLVLADGAATFVYQI